MDLIAKGAEANLYREDTKLVKNRVKKEYRIKELDEKLRKLRTRHEAKILQKASEFGINVPKVLKVDEKEYTLEMEFIDGLRMKDVFEGKKNDASKLSEDIGRILALMHQNDLIHNDLTTSNMLLKGKEIYFIDFGLGYFSTRLEDKAMDLVVFKKSLNASHPSLFEDIWEGVLRGYGPEKATIEKMSEIEKRVRYA